MKSLTTKSVTDSVTNLIDPIVDYARPLATAALPFVIARKPNWGWIAAGSAITIAGVAVGVAISKGWTKSLRENITERISDTWPGDDSDTSDATSTAKRERSNMGGDSASVEEPVLVARGELDELKKRELYDIARSHEIEGRSLMNKDELVDALEDVM